MRMRRAGTVGEGLLEGLLVVVRGCTPSARDGSYSLPFARSGRACGTGACRSSSSSVAEQADRRRFRRIQTPDRRPRSRFRAARRGHRPCASLRHRYRARANAPSGSFASRSRLASLADVLPRVAPRSFLDKRRPRGAPIPPRSRRTRNSSTSPKRTRARARATMSTARTVVEWSARGGDGARARRSSRAVAPSSVAADQGSSRRGSSSPGHPGPTDDETPACARPRAPARRRSQTLQTTPPRHPSGTPSSAPPPRTPATPSESGATGLNFSSFLPGARAAPPASPRPLADESEVLARLNGPDRAVVADVFAARLAALRATRDRWIAGDVRGAAAALTRAGDDSAVVDVCRGALESRTATRAGDALTLELAAVLVPLAAPLLPLAARRARGRGASIQSVGGGGVR